MKKTDKPQPKSSRSKEERIRKAGLFGRIWTALVLNPVIFRYVKTFQGGFFCDALLIEINHRDF